MRARRRSALALHSWRAWAVSIFLLYTAQHASAVEERDTGASQHYIVISGFEFLPPTVRAQRGDIIVWKNEDAVPHSIVRSDNAENLSVILAHGDTFSYIVGSTLDYECGLHSPMKGVVKVLP